MLVLQPYISSRFAHKSVFALNIDSVSALKIIPFPVKHMKIFFENDAIIEDAIKTLKMNISIRRSYLTWFLKIIIIIDKPSQPSPLDLVLIQDMVHPILNCMKQL